MGVQVPLPTPLWPPPLPLLAAADLSEPSRTGWLVPQLGCLLSLGVRSFGVPAVRRFPPFALVRRQRGDCHMSEPPDGSAAQHRLIERHTDAIGSAVLICDPDGVIVDCNRTATELLGLSRSELVGRSVADAEWLSAASFAEDGRPLDEFSVPALADLRAGRSIPPTVVGAHLQGQSEPVWILVCAHPLPLDDQGRPAGAVLTVTDITAQKRAEALYAAVADELHGVL